MEMRPSPGISRPSGPREQPALVVRRRPRTVCPWAGHSASPSPKYVHIHQWFPKSVVILEAQR